MDKVALVGLTVLFFAIFIVGIIVAAFFVAPADVTYEDHGTGRAIDIMAFEFSHGPGLWSHNDWKHVPVDNVILHLANGTQSYNGVDRFEDSYNPYLVIDVCDESHQFQCGELDFYISGGPLAFSDYQYHEDNNTLEYFIDESFTMAKQGTNYFIY